MLPCPRPAERARGPVLRVQHAIPRRPSVIATARRPDRPNYPNYPAHRGRVRSPGGGSQKSWRPWRPWRPSAILAVPLRDETRMTDEFEAMRAAMREEFFGKLFLLGGF